MMCWKEITNTAGFFRFMRTTALKPSLLHCNSLQNHKPTAFALKNFSEDPKLLIHIKYSTFDLRSRNNKNEADITKACISNVLENMIGMRSLALKAVSRNSRAQNVGMHNVNQIRKMNSKEFIPIPVDLEHYTSGWNIGDIEDFTKSGTYSVRTFNKISPKGLARFPKEWYKVEDESNKSGPANVIVLRSHKLREEEVDVSVRAIARCGAGTNNIPVSRMTELGIPVFNTPGANANAVKELIICGMLLGSRRVVDGINHMTKLGGEGTAKERVEKDKALFGGRELKGKTLAVIGLGHIGAATARDARALGMKIQGYDPGLSVRNALSLPRDVILADSIASAVATADYISINIPYVKGKPETGGTHGIIGDDVIGHFKQDAVLLNFARGELVDSEAMKRFLDSGNGRYVSDFPDDILWNHHNAIILPHLGASTEEAEDEAAAMAADTLREYIEEGTIRNSVNFPETSMPERHDRVIRVTVVNKNIPGMLSRITDCFAKAGVNIAQQINQSRGEIAYNVIDLDPSIHKDDEPVNLKDLQKEVTMLDGVLSSRVLFGTPGLGYARNVNGIYFV